MDCAPVPTDVPYRSTPTSLGLGAGLKQRATEKVARGDNSRKLGGIDYGMYFFIRALL